VGYTSDDGPGEDLKTREMKIRSLTTKSSLDRSENDTEMQVQLKVSLGDLLNSWEIIYNQQTTNRFFKLYIMHFRRRESMMSRWDARNRCRISGGIKRGRIRGRHALLPMFNAYVKSCTGRFFVGGTKSGKEEK